MSTEKRRKFALSGIFRRRRTDKLTEEVGIDLLHPVGDDGPTKSSPSNGGGRKTGISERLEQHINNPLYISAVFYLLTFHGLQVSSLHVQHTVTISPI